MLMKSILTLDIGSSSMRAVHYDTAGGFLHSCSRGTVPSYRGDKCVELDAAGFVDSLLSLLQESSVYTRKENLELLAISVTSQRSSVVPVNRQGEPLTPFIMWHDKRTVEVCRKLQPYEDRVYQKTGLRISPVFSAAKMTWLRQEMPEVYKNTAKMLGVHDVVIHALCGRFVTDHSLASNTCLLNLATRQWDQELLDIFSVSPAHLCELIPPGSVCGGTTSRLRERTGIPEHTPVISAGGDQQCAALGLGVIEEGKLKCTTGTGTYLIAHTNAPIIDEKKRFLCKIGAIPGSYNLEAGLLTTGTVYRWFFEQFYRNGNGSAEIELMNQEVLTSPPGAGGVILLPHFEGSGAPHWNPQDCGVFYGMNLSTSRSDMARAVLEGIVMEMGENISLFRQKLGTVSQVSISGGLTKFPAYNQLQADVFGSDVVLHANRESTSLGAWISAAVTCGLYATHQEALHAIRPPGSERIFSPDRKKTESYKGLNARRKKLYMALRSMTG